MQTAVQWLEEQLYSAKELDLVGVIQQAKQMEKAQLIDAYMARMDMTDKEYFKQIIGVEYYNQTFKND